MKSPCFILLFPLSLAIRFTLLLQIPRKGTEWIEVIQTPFDWQKVGEAGEAEHEKRRRGLRDYLFIYVFIDLIWFETHLGFQVTLGGGLQCNKTI